jgi:endonuclease/exonuclease/phosphatase (EEP) superfamily protein YafD
VAAPWLAWAIVRGFGLEFGFPLVPLMAYTPYVAVATIVPLAVAVLLRCWVVAEIVIVAGMLLLVVIVPRASGGPEEPQPGSIELRVVSANIYRGRADMADLMQIVRDTDADLLSIQELTPEAVQELDRLGLRRRFPYRTQVSAGEYFGGGLFSRFPLRDRPPVRTPPSVAATGELLSMPRAFLLAPGAALVDVVAAHPYAPVRGHVGDWEQGLDALPAAEEGPVGLLIGDFNATLDLDSFRDLIGEGYRDAGEVMGDGLTPTWRAGSVIPPPVTIDHVLADERVEIGDYEVHNLPGSDHEALSATLFLPHKAG